MSSVYEAVAAVRSLNDRSSQEYHLLYVLKIIAVVCGYGNNKSRYVVDLAKTSPHILNAERFAMHLGTFLVSKYAHISKAFITVEQLRWARIKVGDEASPEGHPHSFVRDGDDKRIVKVEVPRTLEGFVVNSDFFFFFFFVHVCLGRRVRTREG